MATDHDPSIFYSIPGRTCMYHHTRLIGCEGVSLTFRWAGHKLRTCTTLPPEKLRLQICATVPSPKKNFLYLFGLREQQTARERAFLSTQTGREGRGVTSFEEMLNEMQASENLMNLLLCKWMDTKETAENL
jgi:hypothetical protein